MASYIKASNGNAQIQNDIKRINDNCFLSIIVIAFWKYRMLWKSTISKKMMAKPEEREFRKESVFLIYDPLKVAVKSSQFAST